MGRFQPSRFQVSARKTLARALAGGVLLAGMGTGAAWGQQATNLVCSACVGSGDLANGAVTSSKIGGGAVTNGKIAANAVNTPKIATGAVTAPKIAPNAVNASKIATGAVTAAKIASGAVNVNKLANSAVSTAKIQAGAVTTDRLADGAVTNAKIGAGAVEGPAIADGAVTPEKLSFSTATPDDIDTLTAKTENLAHLRARGASTYVFVSSQKFNGNLGGIAGADQKCQDLADAAGLPGTYFAWLADSDPANAPASRFTQAPNAYLRPGIGSAAPQVVADDWADLTDGSLDLAINVTENGAQFGGFLDVWSNVTAPRDATIGGQPLFGLDLDGWARSNRVWGTNEHPMDGGHSYGHRLLHCLHQPLLLRPVGRGQECKHRHRLNQGNSSWDSFKHHGFKFLRGKRWPAPWPAGSCLLAWALARPGASRRATWSAAPVWGRATSPTGP